MSEKPLNKLTCVELTNDIYLIMPCEAKESTNQYIRDRFDELRRRDVRLAEIERENTDLRQELAHYQCQEQGHIWGPSGEWTVCQRCGAISLGAVEQSPTKSGETEESS